MLKKVFKFTFIFSFIVTIFLIIFARNINNIFFKTQNISNYIVLLAPIIIFMYIDTAVDSILKGLDKQFQVMKINILDLITTIFLILFFLPISGKMGYIIILYFSEILNCMLSIKALQTSAHNKSERQ